MDHTAAEATFIEITFGINTVFTIYPDFRKWIETQATDSIKECSSRLKVLETKPEHKSRTQKAVLRISSASAKHLEVQTHIGNIMSLVASCFAIFCVLILYFDFLDALGKYNCILILPSPVFSLLTYINHLIFRWRVRSISSKFKEFIGTYESDPDLELPDYPIANLSETSEPPNA